MKTDLLIIGGGVAGISAAVEAAETGLNVVLLEREHYLGGRVLQMYRYFPKMCPPVCGLEINFRRIRQSNRIKVFTGAEPTRIEGVAGEWNVTVIARPRFVTSACNCCGDCEKACEMMVSNPLDFGLTQVKAVRLPHPLAYPFTYLVDERALADPRMSAVAKVCKMNAIRLNMTVETIKFEAAEILWATGWSPYDAANLDDMNFGRHPNIVTNMMFERIADIAAHKGEKLTRPSDGGALRSVAFIQCAGSRDVKHLPYCSAVCCMASLKQSRYIREMNPDAEQHIFFIDSRTPGRWEDFYQMVQDDPKTIIYRGKVGKIDPAEDGRVVVIAENTINGKLERIAVDLAVLAVGMVPNSSQALNGHSGDEFGFIYDGAVGVASGPKDVATAVEDATGAVMTALARLKGRR